MTHEPIVRTARTTGAFYLALGITGMLGFLMVRPALFVAGDPAATLANLVGNQAMARLGIALEMGVVITQTLAALWFFRLFRRVDDFAAGAIAQGLRERPMPAGSRCCWSFQRASASSG